MTTLGKLRVTTHGQSSLHLNNMPKVQKFVSGVVAESMTSSLDGLSQQGKSESIRTKWYATTLSKQAMEKRIK